MRSALSIVTPYNGTKDIQFFFQSLLKQSLIVDDFELIIAHEEDCDLKFVQSLLGELDLPAKMVSVPIAASEHFHTAGILRNAGAKIAEGERLVFIDCDCILHRECLLEHFNFHKSEAESLLLGTIDELPWHNRQWLYSNDDIFVISKKLFSVDYRLKIPMGQNVVRIGSWQEMYAGNFSISALAYQELNGFDESGYRCHDMDLAYRLYVSGYCFKFSTTCRSVHLEHPKSIRFRHQQVKGWQWLAKKYPELAEFTAEKCKQLMQHYYMLSNVCHSRFLRVARHLNIDKTSIIDKTILLKVQHDGKLQELLSKIPHRVHHNSSCIRYQLRLNKECWDYNIILTKTFVQPKYSILIPFRNNIKELERSVKSVLKQTFQNFEVILINDCSGEVDLSILGNLLKFERVRCIDNSTNLGQSLSLNIGLMHAQGKYIVQLDADDWLAESALENLDALLETDDFVAVYGNPFLVLKNDILFKKGFQINEPFLFFQYKEIQAPRVYCTETLKAMGGWSVADAYSGRYYEDRLTLSRIAEKGKIGFLKKPVYYVDLKEDSLSRRKPLETASAKLSIVVNEMNHLNFWMKHRYHNGFLQTNILPKAFVEISRTWSIIIPFSRNKTHLQLVLKSWEEAASKFITTGQVELIVVDDTQNFDLASLSKDFCLIRIYHTGGNRGAAYARNYGVSLSKNDYLFFCDEDHVVSRDVLTGHEYVHGQHDENTIVIGGAFGRRAIYTWEKDMPLPTCRTILQQSWLKKDFDVIATAAALNEEKIIVAADKDVYKTLFEHSFTEQWQREWGEIFCNHGFSLDGFDHAWLKCGTGNLSVSRVSFYNIGEFDERLRSMEDWELGLRAMRQEVKIVMAPFAEPFHLMHAKHKKRDEDDQSAINYLKATHATEIKRLIDSNKLNSLVNQFRDNNKQPLSRTVEKSPYVEQLAQCCLTFDDGPHGYTTIRLLELLSELQLKATFFVLGSSAVKHADIIHRMAIAGHEIGIHSWHHHSVQQYSFDSAIAQINQTSDLLQQMTGKAINLVRPPYGIINQQVIERLKEENYHVIGWHNSAKDWTRGITERQIISNVAIGGVRNKILLFHDTTGEPHALFGALRWLHNLLSKNEIEFVTVSKYLESNDLIDIWDGLRLLPSEYDHSFR